MDRFRQEIKIVALCPRSLKEGHIAAIPLERFPIDKAGGCLMQL
jgi:hypothetical protein